MKITKNTILDDLRFETLPKDYKSLCAIYLPRPIHNRLGYSEAEKMADLMAGFEERMSAEQNDYFAVVTAFMADYENELPRVSPSEALAFLMEEHSMNASDLARLLVVDRSQGARLVNGERNLTVTQIAQLSERFGVEPGVFIDSTGTALVKRTTAASPLRAVGTFSRGRKEPKSTLPVRKSFPHRKPSKIAKKTLHSAVS